MPLLVKRGMKLHPHSGKNDEVDTSGTVFCYHMDADRDKALGYALSKYSLNYIFDTEDSRDYRYKDTLLKAVDPNALPSTIDLRSQWGDLFDQGDIGSCVSNSVGYQLRYLIRKSTGKIINMSRLFIYYNGRSISGYPVNQDTGLTMRNGFKSVTSYGAPQETMWPYITSDFADKPSDAAYKSAAGNRNLAYYSVAQNLNEIKKCLKDGYAISFGITLFSSFMTTTVARSGKIPVPNQSVEQRVGGHAMTIIGYEDATSTFIIANSWGQAWGDGGFCHMPYSMILDTSMVGDLWTPRSYAVDGMTPSPAPAPAPAPSPAPAPTPTPTPTPSTTPKWAPNTWYNIGDVVMYLNQRYTCQIKHQSNSIWTPIAVPALWRWG